MHEGTPEQQNHLYAEGDGKKDGKGNDNYMHSSWLDGSAIFIITFL